MTVITMVYFNEHIRRKSKPVGTVKIPGHGTTPAGAKGIGSGFSVALSDGSAPGKVPAGEDFAPTILDGNSNQSGSALDITV
jgi:hypothetical protein